MVVVLARRQRRDDVIVLELYPADDAPAAATRIACQSLRAAELLRYKELRFSRLGLKKQLHALLELDCPKVFDSSDGTFFEVVKGAQTKRNAE